MDSVRTPSGSCYFVLLSCILASWSPAQTFIVDAAGGGGSHYRDLPPAIAGVPSGAVLRVRPGNYSAFTITNKRLSILADDGAVVDLRNPVVIGPTQVGDHVILHNLVFHELGNNPASDFTITGTAGRVVLDRCTIDPAVSLRHVIRVSQAADVHLLGLRAPRHLAFFGASPRMIVESSSVEMTRCFVEIMAAGGGLSNPIHAALEVSQSRAILVDCIIQGGAGANAGGCGLPSQPPAKGGPAIRATASFVHAYGGLSQFLGGNAGLWPFNCSNNPRPAGGPGMDLVNSTARVLGHSPTGGLGGSPGRPIETVGGTLDWQPAAIPPVASLAGIPQRGQVVQFQLSAAPNSLAALALGYDHTHLALPPIGLGSLLVIPALTVTTNVPSNGSASLPLQLPISWPFDESIVGQWFTLSGSEIWASNSFVVLVKS